MFVYTILYTVCVDVLFLLLLPSSPLPSSSPPPPSPPKDDITLRHMVQ